jgi:hypothetical protein
MMRKSSGTNTKNEGEGNRSADRRYRNAAAQHAASGASEAAARKAKRALEGSEREELTDAEQAGKAARKSAAQKRH